MPGIVQRVRPRPDRAGTATRKLGQEFDPRRNALNAWRLALATGVILWHSFVLTRQVSPWGPVHQFLGDGMVDGFFAISGFLITASWFSNPRPRIYFAARGLRILPGLWVCLIVTAFVIAPLSVAIQGGPVAKLLLSRAPIVYVLMNGALLSALGQHNIGPTPNGVHWPHEWNGSLWTLAFEVECYVMIAGLGVAGLLHRRWFIPTALALTLVWSALLPPWSSLIDSAQSHHHVGIVVVAQTATARLLTMFLAGALLYQLRNVILARWSLVVLSAVLVGVALLTPNYRLLGAIPFAYAIIVSGALVRHERLRLRTDLSYGTYIYAFPIQQLLLVAGLAVNAVLFTLIAAAAVLPVAAGSWFLVEKPAMGLKMRLKQTSIAPAQRTGHYPDEAQFHT